MNLWKTCLKRSSNQLKNRCEGVGFFFNDHFAADIICIYKMMFVDSMG